MTTLSTRVCDLCCAVKARHFVETDLLLLELCPDCVCEITAIAEGSMAVYDMPYGLDEECHLTRITRYYGSGWREIQTTSMSCTQLQDKLDEATKFGWIITSNLELNETPLPPQPGDTWELHSYTTTMTYEF